MRVSASKCHTPIGLLCLSTVYIYAHYAIDVLAGWASAAVLFAALGAAYKNVKE